jgi:hypothetical protein
VNASLTLTKTPTGRRTAMRETPHRAGRPPETPDFTHVNDFEPV